MSSLPVTYPASLRLPLRCVVNGPVSYVTPEATVNVPETVASASEVFVPVPESFKSTY